MDYIIPLCEAVRLSAENRGKLSPDSYDSKMLKKLSVLLCFMMEKGFASFTWHNATHPEIDPVELQVWVKDKFREILRVETMKNFFSITILK